MTYMPHLEAMDGSSKDEDELVSLFCRLVSIPSPSGREADVARLIRSELSRRGVPSHEDGAARTNQSNTGNVIAELEGGRTKLIFIAHMDTVEAGDRRIKPIVGKGRIRSEGTTILGADNKAGVAPLIAALGDIAKMSGRPTVTGIFSTREEEGIMGVQHLPHGAKSDFTFVLDSEGDVGSFINKALGSTLFDIEIYGREAHAALEPEKGANAVKAAGMVINSLRLGRRPHDSILNIGVISGGRKRNVIPGSVIMKGGTRAFDNRTIEAALKEVETATRRACKATGCSYKIRKDFDEGEPPFHTKADDAIMKLAEGAARKAGVRFKVGKRMATFEANVLAGRGYSRILVMCHGGRMPHSTREEIRISDLQMTRRLIVEMARLASHLS